MMNNGDLFDLLIQLPRDQILEFGMLDQADPGLMVCMQIEDIVLAQDSIILLDTEDTRLIQDVGSSNSSNSTLGTTSTAVTSFQLDRCATKNIGEILDALTQYPRDRAVEFGIVDPEDPCSVTCVPIEDIHLTERSVVLVDPTSSKSVEENIKTILGIGKKPRKQRDEENELQTLTEQIDRTDV